MRSGFLAETAAFQQNFPTKLSNKPSLQKPFQHPTPRFSDLPVVEVEDAHAQANGVQPHRAQPAATQRFPGAFLSRTRKKAQQETHPSPDVTSGNCFLGVIRSVYVVYVFLNRACSSTMMYHDAWQGSGLLVQLEWIKWYSKSKQNTCAMFCEMTLTDAK